MITLSKKAQLLGMAAALALLAAAPAFAAQPAYQTTRTTTVRTTQPAVAPTYAVDPSIPLWAGPYVGGHIGGVWSDFTNDAPAAGPNGSSSSFTGGAQLGYNWQMNRMVYGLEVDGSWLDLSSRNGGTHFKENWQATARGRVGYAVGPWLPYVTGGVAFTGTEREFGASSTNNVQAGWTAGAGVEKYISPRWSAKVEYLYTDVSKTTENVGGTSVAGGSANNAARLGFNYHF